MRKLFLLAGVAALTAAIPAAAEAQGRGNGRGNSVRIEQQTRVQAHRYAVRARAAARAEARLAADRRARRDAERTWIDRNRDGIDDRATGRRYGGAACPPGLANRNPPCVPPGQARRAFREGQVLPRSYSYYTPYDTLLSRLDPRYRDDIPAGYRYIYRDDAVYVVDPRTRIVRSIIDLLD
jgi:hypothetical protein